MKGVSFCPKSSGREGYAIWLVRFQRVLTKRLKRDTIMTDSPEALSDQKGTIMMIRCPNCGYEGKPRRGSGHGCAEVLILLFLFCFFIIPGIFYLVYLIARPTPISCPMCRYRHVVKLPDPPKPPKIKKSRVKRDPLLTPDGSINSDFFLKPKPSLLERIAKATGLTKQQIGILSGLALAVLCVLCFGVYIVVSEESASRPRPMATWTPIPGPTATPKPRATPKPTKTPRPRHSEIDARSVCEEFVRDNLVAPSSAKFDYSSERAVHYGDGKYSVTGQFEAQNSFGVMVRSLYICDVHYDSATDKWYLDDLLIE